jgi:hypothetical protein
MKQITGFYTLFHLIREGQLSERSADELADQAETAILSDNQQLKLIAMKVKSLLLPGE